MRFGTFLADGRTFAGIVNGDAVQTIGTRSLRDYIELPAGQRRRRESKFGFALSEARLVAPLIPSRNIFCVGRNYIEHAREVALISGSDLGLGEAPAFFTKTPTTVVGPEADLHLQESVSASYDYEAELGVVIGVRCKDVREEDWRQVVFGYTCVNDVTARDLQQTNGQWFKGKSLDESCPIGPWIVSADEIEDPHDLDISLEVNGVRKQDSNTRNMIHRIPRLIAWLSKGMTLLPGDIIATGTPGGVGFARKPPEFLRDGDVLEVTISRIGTLRNRVRLL